VGPTANHPVEGSGDVKLATEPIFWAVRVQKVRRLCRSALARGCLYRILLTRACSRVRGQGLVVSQKRHLLREHSSYETHLLTFARHSDQLHILTPTLNLTPILTLTLALTPNLNRNPPNSFLAEMIEVLRSRSFSSRIPFRYQDKLLYLHSYSYYLFCSQMI
jgi:hypothetical protein